MEYKSARIIRAMARNQVFDSRYGCTSTAVGQRRGGCDLSRRGASSFLRDSQKSLVRQILPTRSGMSRQTRDMRAALREELRRVERCQQPATKCELSLRKTQTRCLGTQPIYGGRQRSFLLHISRVLTDFSILSSNIRTASRRLHFPSLSSGGSAASSIGGSCSDNLRRRATTPVRDTTTQPHART